MRLGVRSVPLILCLALAASGVAAIATFWIYFAPPAVGPTGAYLVLFGSLGLIAWAAPAAARERQLTRRLAVPLGLWVAATLFVASFGFLYGDPGEPLISSGLRFATDPSPFASDSAIPLFNSQWLFEGHPGSPPVFPGEWQFADRPPLQAGYVLFNRVFETGMPALRYEMLGIALQQLWIVALWALLAAARVARRTSVLVVLAALVGDVVLVNGFYVWPKLMGAAFLLAALALLVSPGEPLVRTRPWSLALVGVLGGLALLCHGSSAFGLIPLAAVALWRGLPDWRWAVAGAAALLLVFGPWLGYQRYGDPPGNRLAKWSLAGSPAVDERGTLEAIADAYEQAGFARVVDNKYRNFLTMIGGNPASGPSGDGPFPYGAVPEEIGDAVGALGDGDYEEAISKVREIRQWHEVWLLGLLPLFLPLILYGRLRGAWRDGPEWQLARFCLFFCGIGLVVWGLLMFGNVAGRALPGSGSFAVPLLGIVGIVAGLRATYPRLAAWLVGANVVTTLLLYAPMLPEDPGYGLSIPALLVAAASLLGAWRISLSEP